MIFATIGVIVGIVASIFDGIDSSTLGQLKGCYNADTGATYGDTTAGANAVGCTFFSSGYDGENCVCAYDTTSSSTSVTCGYFDLASGNNCEIFLTSFPDKIKTSAAFNVAITVLIFVYSIFTCIVSCVCCPCCKSNDPPVHTTDAAPVVVTYAASSSVAMVDVKAEKVAEGV